MGSDIEYLNRVSAGLKARAVERQREYTQFTNAYSGPVDRNTSPADYGIMVLFRNEDDGSAVYLSMPDDIKVLAKLYLGSDPMDWWRGLGNGK